MSRRQYEEVLNKDDAEHFVSMLGRSEEELLLTAILSSLPLINARKAAAKAGYDLEKQ